MTILANPDYFEAEQRGEADQTLVAVRYTGDRRRYSSNGAVNQGRFPANTSFEQGTWYVAFVPERTPETDTGVGVTWFERAGDFEVAHHPAEIAAVLLGKNYVDLETPAGPIGDDRHIAGFSDRVVEALELEDPIEAGATYEEQLDAMADLDEGEAEAVDNADPADELVEENDRAELKERVKSVREDADEFSLRGASMHDMAEFLVEQESDD